MNKILNNASKYYQYFLIIFINIIFYINNSSGPSYLDILPKFLVINVFYLAFVFILKIAYNIKGENNLGAEVVNINLDLIFISSFFILINLPLKLYFLLVLYYVPFISKANYNRKKDNNIFFSIILVYFFIFQLGFKRSMNVDYIIICICFVLFSFFLFYMINFFSIIAEKKENELKKINSFIKEVKYLNDYHDELSNLINALHNLINVPIITIMLFDDERQDLFIAESIGISDKQKSLRLKPGKGVCGNTFKEKKYKVIPDATNKNRNCGFISFEDLPSPVLSELCFPLILSDDSIIGVLNFESYEKNYFNIEIINLMNALIHHIVYILEKSLSDYKYNLGLRSKIDRYTENILFLREIAHEWRNKLNNFVQIPDYILKKNGTDIKLLRELSEVQQNEAAMLDTSLNKALEAKTIYKPKLIKIEISKIFNKITNDTYYLLKKNDIIYNFKFNNYESIHTDLEWIRSIFDNLIINSINAFSKNKIEKRMIDLKYIIKDNYITFILEDNAGGIDEILIKRICDPSAYDIKSGRIGLNMVKKYIHLLRGELICEKSGNLKGTKFIIKFPLVPNIEDE